MCSKIGVRPESVSVQFAMARRKDAGERRPATYNAAPASAPAAANTTQMQPDASRDASSSIEAENLNLIKGMGAAQVHMSLDS